MRFSMKYNNHSIEVEAETLVQAIIKVIDSSSDVGCNAEFVVKLKNDN